MKMADKVKNSISIFLLKINKFEAFTYTSYVKYVQKCKICKEKK